MEMIRPLKLVAQMHRGMCCSEQVVGSGTRGASPADRGLQDQGGLAGVAQGTVAVPDRRLGVLQDLGQSAQAIPTTVEFVDIAGLVKGASKGEGLGNKFLATIRECDSIVQVRCRVPGNPEPYNLPPHLRPLHECVQAVNREEEGGPIPGACRSVFNAYRSTYLDCV